MVESEDTVKEIDQLHILPLAMIPLETAGLRRARLIKNSRLDSVVELFAGKQMGSGQIRPDDLHKTFGDLTPKHPDCVLISALSKLPSYDVYSLRVQLRRLGIEVDNHESLRLSDDQISDLAAYMRVFTRPLVRAIYGDEATGEESFRDIVQVFRQADAGTAMRNLAALADRLDTELIEVPNFLEDYADVYLSLAYYQYCLDEISPSIEIFIDTLDLLASNPNFSSQVPLMRTFSALRSKLVAIASDVRSILDMFRARTQDVWDDISAGAFNGIRTMIVSFQSKIGGALCALTVKMNAWQDQFPNAEAGSAFRRVDFILSDMRPGIDRVEEINYADA